MYNAHPQAPGNSSTTSCRLLPDEPTSLKEEVTGLGLIRKVRLSFNHLHGMDCPFFVARCHVLPTAPCNPNFGQPNPNPKPELRTAKKGGVRVPLVPESIDAEHLTVKIQLNICSGRTFL